MTDAKTSASITPSEDGPLIAAGVDRMVLPNGDDADIKPRMALCRCGRSSNKPFCDGSHNAAGFKGTSDGEGAGRDKLITYPGESLTVLYNPRLCSHAARCGALAPAAFDPSQRPWVQPDKADAAKVKEVVANCPSGALQLQEDGHLLTDRATITIEENGPYWVQGARVDAPAPGEGASPDKFVLCRCGLSGNKPYCDGSHRDAGWQSND